MTEQSEISADVRAFIASHVTSVERLAILLLLLGKPDKFWDADAVASELNLPRSHVERELEKLGARNLLDIRIGGSVLYRYNPATDELARRVDRLAEAHLRQRTAVLKAVIAAGEGPLRDFADAFRVWGEDDDDG